MPPVLGPRSPSPTALWSWAVPNSSTLRPSTRANRLASSPRRHSSITTVSPALPKAPPKACSRASSACSTVGGHGHPLAGREPVRLDHDRRALRADVGLGRVALAPREGPRRCGRDAVAGAERLGERLGAFEPRGGGARSRDLDAGRLQAIGQAQHQRQLGPGHHEVDLLLATERGDAVEIVDRERHAGGLARDRIAARRAPAARSPGAMRRATSTAHARVRPRRPPETSCPLASPSTIEPGRTL